MSATIKAFTTLLYSATDAGTLHNAVGGRMYSNFAPQDAPLPLLVYEVSSSSIEYYFGGASRIQATAIVRLWFTVGATAAAFAAEDLLFTLAGNTTMAAPSGSGLSPIALRCTSRSVHTMIEDAISITSTFQMEASTT